MIQSIICQLLTTVQYLESIGIVHRDIKPENIMLIKEGSDVIIKLADFGLACDIKHQDKFEAGTPGYMAPEVLHYKKFPKEWWLTTKVDVYSIGCILYQL